MTISSTEVDKMQRELAILMTNSVELMNKMYDIFVNPSPGDVELRVWTSNGFETISVPNLAKSRIPVLYGDGSPIEGDIKGSLGSIFIDLITEYIYINTGKDADEDGMSTDWVKLTTLRDLEEHNNSDIAHLGYLAPINGDGDTPFYVADVDVGSDPKLAVNLGSLDAILGFKDELYTTAKDSMCNAINEVFYVAEKELAVVVDSNLNRVKDTQKPKIFQVVNTNGSGDGQSVAIDSGLTKLIAIKADGAKYTCDTISQVQSRVLHGKKIHVFLKDLDKTVPSFECVSDGNYYIGETKPYIMKEGDVWLDIGCRPAKMYQEVKVDGVYEEQEVDYIFLGIIEEM